MIREHYRIERAIKEDGDDEALRATSKTNAALHRGDNRLLEERINDINEMNLRPTGVASCLSKLGTPPRFVMVLS